MSTDKQEIIKKSIEEGKTLNEIKKQSIPEVKKEQSVKKEHPVKKELQKTKAKVTIQGMPEAGIKPQEGTIMLEMTPEMTEALMMGVLDTIALLAPKTFKSPSKRHGELLKMPAHAVIQRWIPQLDILKYLPEIILATSFVSVLKDMKITDEVKK